MKWSGMEKRRSKREEGQFKISFYTPDAQTLPGYAVNMSEGGVKAIFDKRVNIFTILKIKIYSQNQPVSRQGKVVWIRRVKSTTEPYVFQYEAGIEFVKEQNP